MHFYVQWATDPPRAPILEQSENWTSLPKKARPVGGEVIRYTLGWIAYIEVQGVSFHADCYAIEELPPDGIKVYMWNDDEEDWPGDPHAMVWTFRHLAKNVGPGNYKGYNTRQSWVGYCTGDRLANAQRAEIGQWKNWNAFHPPAEETIRYGIWMSDNLWNLHQRLAIPHDWTTWTEGIPTEDISNGKVKI